jgi:hypothetical protein
MKRTTIIDISVTIVLVIFAIYFVIWAVDNPRFINRKMTDREWCENNNGRYFEGGLLSRSSCEFLPK